MIRNIIVLVFCVLFLNGHAFAEKPPWAGKGKPTVEQKQEQKNKKKKDKGIEIMLEIKDSKIKFEVCNVKRKIKSEEIEQSNGFGLINLERRLELAYPGKYKLDIKDESDRYITKLEIRLADEN